MAELDTIYVTNSTNKDFGVRFNGELYEIGAGEKKSYPQGLAFHVAKHLSDTLLRTEIEKIRKKEKENPYRPQVAQLMVYDNPKRRIALYSALNNKDLVEQCIAAYPFKGFVGEMSEYDEFVEKIEKKEVKDESPDPSIKGKADKAE